MATKPSGIGRLLTKHKAALIKDLDVNRAVAKLLRKRVLTKKEEEVLFDCDDHKRKIEILVDILSEKGSSTFHEFCGVLEEIAPHLLTRFLLDGSPGKLKQVVIEKFCVNVIKCTVTNFQKFSPPTRKLSKGDKSKRFILTGTLFNNPPPPLPTPPWVKHRDFFSRSFLTLSQTSPGF